MDTLIFRTRPNDRNECDQWTLVRDADDSEDFVIQERVVLAALMSGKPYARLSKTNDRGRVFDYRSVPGSQTQITGHFKGTPCRAGSSLIGAA
jgi:hypothetical protein